jgi:hypothetical protein
VWDARAQLLRADVSRKKEMNNYKIYFVSKTILQSS